jgi:tetratricopeptide (TPR) repeat protein
VLGELSIFHYVIAKYIESIQFATDALALAIEADDPVLQVEAHWLLGFQKVSIAEYNEALAHLVKVASFYKPEEHHENLVKLRGVDAGLSAMAYQAVCLQLLGYPDQAMQLGSKAIELARKFDHPFTLSDVLCFAGCMLNELRDDGEALQEAATALRQLTHEKQLDGWLGHSKRYKGAAEYISGNIGPAIEIIQEGIATSERTNEILYKAVTLSSLAKAQADLDMVDEGLESLEEALKVVEATGERIWEPEIYRIRGEIHILIGELDRAEENFHTAIKLSKTQQARFWELRATTSLARLWQEQGKTRQAKKVLVEIYGWFTEGFETRDLLEAKALLDELQG